MDQKHDIATCKVQSIATNTAEQSERPRIVSPNAQIRHGVSGTPVDPKVLHRYPIGAGALLLGVKGSRVQIGMESTGHGNNDPILRIIGETSIEEAEQYVSSLMRAAIEAKKNLIEHGAGPFGGGIKPADIIASEKE